MYILGISCYYHDGAAAIIKNGILIAAAEEERFSRIKHDSSFPKKAVEFCLREAGIKADDISYVVFYEKPFLKFERIFLTALVFSPRSYTFFRESMKKWLFDRLWIKSHIVRELGVPFKKILFSEHHLSHVSSSFYCSPFKESAVISIDAVGEWSTTSWGTGRNKKIRLVEEVHFPNSLGLLYSAFTVFAGFEANEGEYKLMGLAPYGKPRYLDKIKKVINVLPDGSYSLNLRYFSFQYLLQETVTRKFIDLFGNPNLDPDEIVPYYADIACSIQEFLEVTLIKIAKYVKKRTSLEYLCFAGGVALNSKANWRIANESGFKEIYIQPSAGDAGGALGAALFIYHNVLGKKRNFVMNNVYWGEKLSLKEAVNYLKNKKIKHRKFKDRIKFIDYLTERLVKGYVVGWLQDEFEWGPRALGHRSILADPRSYSMRDRVNSKIKFREGFRPFAPSVLSEYSDKYFSVGGRKKDYPFKFMQYVVSVKKKYKSKLEAVTHTDGTARPQFVDRKTNNLYYELINAFGKKSGVFALLNTSFNLKGDPIVNNFKDAYKTFKKSGIDILAVNGEIVISK